MIHHPFHLAVWFDLAATFLAAVTGALAALRKRYDLVGVVVLALVTALAGSMLRDLLLQRGPPAALVDARYLGAVLAGAAAAAAFRSHLHRLRLVFSLADALALGIYGVLGTQKTLAAGLPVLAALLLGTINSVGGSVVRDVLVREEPLLFKPGEWYALAAFAGCAAFAALVVNFRLDASHAAVAAIGVAFAARLLSIRLGWRTGPLAGADPDFS
jgi:uncharacterized membrane protein YeiH